MIIDWPSGNPYFERTGFQGETYNIEDFDRANKNILYLIELMKQINYDTFITLPYSSDGVKTIANVGMINSIEERLKTIEDTRIKTPVDWLVKRWVYGIENPSPNFDDMNRWEKIIEELSVIVSLIYDSMRYCGSPDFSCGNDY